MIIQNQLTVKEQRTIINLFNFKFNYFSDEFFNKSIEYPKEESEDFLPWKTI
ncbi:MAG: hypothetical protein WC705_02875 [Candidatus Paceibacterota bacterium]